MEAHMNNSTETKIEKIDKLISFAQSEKERHIKDENYWGTESDINSSNSFFDEVGSFLGINISEDKDWGSYLLKATSIEAYDFSINKLNILKSNIMKNT
jgi:hypothetical protein